MIVVVKPTNNNVQAQPTVYTQTIITPIDTQISVNPSVGDQINITDRGNLNNLFDVDINIPQNNQSLVYENGFWVNKSIIGGVQLEDTEVLSKRTDQVGETQIYIGEAQAGSLESSSVWRIKLINLASDGDTSTTWAEGNTSYDKQWTERLTYVYS